MHSAPWFRKHDGWWYFYRREDGRRRQVKLVEGRANRAAAFELWHELCRKPISSPVVSSETVVALLDVFLGWVRKNRAAGTYLIYRQHLESFGRHVGRGFVTFSPDGKWLAYYVRGTLHCVATKDALATAKDAPADEAESR